MGVGVAALGVAAAIAECVELLDVAEPQAGLFFDPRAQPDFQRAMRDGIERTERQPRQFVAVAAGCGQDQGLVVLDGHDGRRQPDLDRREDFIGHSV